MYPKVGSINHPITDEANALVLDEHGEVVSLTFNRIRDLADPYADIIAWDADPQTQLQEDGVLIKLDLWREKLLITTKEGIGGKEYLPGLDNRRLEGALSAFLYQKYQTAKPACKFHNEFSYIFQFVYPKENTVYRHPELVLLAMMDKTKGTELCRESVDRFANNGDFCRPIQTSIKKLYDVFAIGSNLAEHARGIVVVDRNGNRVLYRNRVVMDILERAEHGEGIYMKKFAETVLNGDQEKIKYYFPLYADILDIFTKCLKEAKTGLNTFWDNNRGLPKGALIKQTATHPLRGVLLKRVQGHIHSFNEIEQFLSANRLIILTSRYFSRKYTALYTKLVKSVNTTQ